jgi:hypothetical protein
MMTAGQFAGMTVSSEDAYASNAVVRKAPVTPLNEESVSLLTQERPLSWNPTFDVVSACGRDRHA